MTITTSGLFLVGFTASCNAGGAWSLELEMKKNGGVTSVKRQVSAASGIYQTLAAVGIIEVAENDYLQVIANAATGTPSTDNATAFGIHIGNDLVS